MKDRMLRARTWDDERVGRLSFGAQLLLHATFGLADDEGLLRWNPVALRNGAFPYRDIHVNDVAALMTELVDAGLVYVWTLPTTGDTLAYVVNFHVDQKLRHRTSKLPAPPLRDPGVVTMYAQRDRWHCHVCDTAVTQGPASGDSEAVLHHLHDADPHPSNIRLSHAGCVPVYQARVQQAAEQKAAAQTGTTTRPARAARRATRPISAHQPSDGQTTIDDVTVSSSGDTPATLRMCPPVEANENENVDMHGSPDRRMQMVAQADSHQWGRASPRYVQL